VLAITAHSPEGEDAGAYGFLRKLTEAGRDGASYGGLLTGTFGKNVMGSRYKKVVEKQRELLSRFPNSRYARYVEYSLGLTYRNQEDEELFLRGVGLLERAASYEDFFLAEKALEELYRTFRNRGEPEKARQYQKRIAEIAPDSGIGRDYLEQKYRAKQREGSRAKGECAGSVEDVIGEQSDPGFRWEVGFGVIAMAVVGVGVILFLRKKLI
jgi:tetratricopeptide (TPR) repeat protein